MAPGEPWLCSQSRDLPAVGRNRALPCSTRPKALLVLDAEAWCLGLPLASSIQGRDLAVENTPFLLVEALLEGCASSEEAFTTEVALRAPRGVLQLKGQAPPLRPLPAWPRGSSSKAKAPGPQLARSSNVEMPACLGKRLPEIKSNLFL